MDWRTRRQRANESAPERAGELCEASAAAPAYPNLTANKRTGWHAKRTDGRTDSCQSSGPHTQNQQAPIK